MITAWRITKLTHSRNAFSGSGAKKFGGRWNSPGTSMVYTAQSQALAALEILAHLDVPELLQAYVLIAVQFEAPCIETIAPNRLPRRWQIDPARPELREIGDRWVAEARSAVLQVPSALVPNESNFLLNVRHPDFAKIRIAKPVSFRFDPRLSK